MDRCSLCGREVQPAHRCGLCNDVFCEEHAQPGSHSCERIRERIRYNRARHTRRRHALIQLAHKA